jgi:predicted nucleic acid-binding protein
MLCRFPLKGKPYIHDVLQYVTIILPEGVVVEARGGTGVIAHVAFPLLKAGQIKSAAAPDAPTILDTAYGNDLGVGERHVIKIALAQKLPAVIDDREAFIVACRFGLYPIGFQDFIVRLVKELAFPNETALDIVKTTARQYPKMFLAHTLDMLGVE